MGHQEERTNRHRENMKLSQVAEGIAKNKNRFERMFSRYFKEAPPNEIDPEEFGGDGLVPTALVYYPRADIMITHDGAQVERIVRYDDNERVVELGIETVWIRTTIENLKLNPLKLWKKINY